MQRLPQGTITNIQTKQSFRSKLYESCRMNRPMTVEASTDNLVKSTRYKPKFELFDPKRQKYVSKIFSQTKSSKNLVEPKTLSINESQAKDTSQASIVTSNSNKLDLFNMLQVIQKTIYEYQEKTKQIDFQKEQQQQEIKQMKLELKRQIGVNKELAIKTTDDYNHMKLVEARIEKTLSHQDDRKKEFDALTLSIQKLEESIDTINQAYSEYKQQIDEQKQLVKEQKKKNKNLKSELLALMKEKEKSRQDLLIQSKRNPQFIDKYSFLSVQRDSFINDCDDIFQQL